MTKGVFIFVTSNACASCKFYKANPSTNGWIHLQSKLLEIGDIELVELTLPEMRFGNDVQLPTSYPSGLKKYMYWYPMFMLVPWDKYYEPTTLDLNAEIYQGIWEPHLGQYVVERPANFDTTQIISWINKTLKTSKFNSQTESNNSHYRLQNFKLPPNFNLHSKEIELFITDNGVPLGKLQVDLPKPNPTASDTTNNTSPPTDDKTRNSGIIFRKKRAR